MDSESAAIEQLYKNYEILSEAKDKIEEHAKEYQEILNAVKGSAKEKRLASQFIGKFFKFFPDLADTAIDAQLDLCEDEDIQTRRQAIKDLPQLCKDTKEHTPKISDILSQLLIVEDPGELNQVHISLQNLAKMDAEGTLAGVFRQLTTGDETTRDRCFDYILRKFRSYGPDILTEEVEDFLIVEVKKILQDVGAEEFQLCMKILESTKLISTVSGHNDLVTLACDQAELDSDLDPIAIDDEIVERFIQCATYALPYFSSQVESTPFIKFICEKFLPVTTWNLMAASFSQYDQTQLRLLKVFAEMCAYCGPLEKPADKIEAIFNVLLEYMPLPPVDTDLFNHDPSFEFSHAECLLYIIHSIGKQSPDFLSFSDDPAKLKDFRSRLQYLARGTQGYIKILKEAVKGKTPEELDTDANKIKVTALKTTSNISALIRDLFHTPPSFKTPIQLSWVAKKPQLTTKRHAPITFGSNLAKTKNGKEDGAKRVRSAHETSSQRVYTPPSGKYSLNVSNYSHNGGKSYKRAGNRNRGGAGGRGGGGGGQRNGGQRSGNKNFRGFPE